MLNTITAILHHHAGMAADKVFTRHVTASGVSELTFGQCAERASSLADAFSAQGLEKGAVALIFLPTSPDALPAFLGVMQLGAIPSFMPCPSAKQHPSIYWPSHQALLARIGARMLITDEAHARQMREHGLETGECTILAIENLPHASPIQPCPAEPDAIALLQHSSGTTALKKGVALSHRAILAQAAAYASRLGASGADNVVSWLPVYHDMGLIACSILPLVLGQTVTILDPFQWAARPAALFDAIDAHDGHFAWLPNFAFEHLTRTVPADHACDLSRMRAFINCSEPCKAESMERFAARFAGLGVRREQLQLCYAMAETVFAVTQTAPGEPVRSLELDREALQRDRIVRQAGGAAEAPGTQRVLSTGAPVAGIRIELRDEGEALGEDRVGEIVVSGEFLFDGYHNDAATTAERLAGGFYRTRDLGFMHRGELYVLGRKDDLLIVNGRNLHAHEVEAIVGGVPGLKPGRAVAFGVYNPAIASEELVIVAERDASPVDEAALGRTVRGLVLDQTNIDVKDFRIVEPGWLVKTTSGKISREKNREKYLLQAEREADAPAPAGDGEDAFASIAGIIAALFRHPLAHITRATVAGDVGGWDSLAHTTLMLKIEQELGIKFPDEDIFSFTCVGDLAERAAALQGEAAPGATSRVIYESRHASIIQLGADTGGPDLVIFAGAALKFAGQDMLDFASTLNATGARQLRKFFVTDRQADWYGGDFATLIAQINRLSSRPKIVIGNSMGGYAALKFAPHLADVLGVLSFVPAVPRPGAGAAAAVAAALDGIGPRAATPYCILFGEIEDGLAKSWIAANFTDADRHHVCAVPSCGHNVVPYLNRIGALPRVLETALRPATMGSEVRAILAGIAPSPDDLRRRINHLPFPQMAEALRQVGRVSEIRPGPGGKGRTLARPAAARQAGQDGTGVLKAKEEVREFFFAAARISAALELALALQRPRISSLEWGVLQGLEAEGAANPLDLARRLAITLPLVKANTQRLLVLGLIDVAVSQDSPTVVFDITDQGRANLRKLDAAFEGLTEDLNRTRPNLNILVIARTLNHLSAAAATHMPQNQAAPGRPAA